MRPGEICLASFPFGDTAGMKLRPVLILAGPLGSIPEVLVAYISSVLPIARHLGNLPQSQKTTVAAKLRDLLAAW
jgi:hypothetical protein